MRVVIQGSPLVWVCLADVIVGVVEEAVTSSAVVEGLWMCRTHLLKDEQVKIMSVLSLCSNRYIVSV